MAERAGRKPKATPPAPAPPPTGGEGGDGRALEQTDNERKVYLAEQAQLQSYVHQIMAQERTLEKEKAAYKEAEAELRVPMDAAKDRLTELFRLAKAAKFQRNWIEDYIAKIKAGVKATVEDIQRARRHEGMLGIPTSGDQLDMFADGGPTPTEIKDENRWRAEGYLAYHRGEVCRPPTEASPRFHQPWMAGWNDAQTATVLAMKTVEAEPPPAATAPDEDETVDAFEAFEDELEGQTTRRVIHERRAESEAI